MKKRKAMATSTARDPVETELAELERAPHNNAVRRMGVIRKRCDLLWNSREVRAIADWVAESGAARRSCAPCSE